jgi:hypothetical protein
MTDIEHSIGKIEGRLDAIDQRHNSNDERVVRIELKVDGLGEQMSSVSGAWKLLMGVAVITAAFAAAIVESIHRWFRP